MTLNYSADRHKTAAKRTLASKCGNDLVYLANREDFYRGVPDALEAHADRLAELDKPTDEASVLAACYIFATKPVACPWSAQEVADRLSGRIVEWFHGQPVTPDDAEGLTVAIVEDVAEWIDDPEYIRHDDWDSARDIDTAAIAKILHPIEDDLYQLAKACDIEADNNDAEALLEVQRQKIAALLLTVAPAIVAEVETWNLGHEPDYDHAVDVDLNDVREVLWQPPWP